MVLVPILAFVALLAWGMSSPLGASPDDDFHLDSIWCSSAFDQSSCLPGSAPDKRVVPAALVHSACFAGDSTISAACQGKGSPSSRPTVDTDRGNFANNYPPVYYATMGLFVTPDILGSVWFMRLVNVLLFVAITTALACLLPLQRRAALITGWLITTVPLGAFLLASNNPSAWALIGVGSSWLALLGYFESTGKRRIALGALFALTVFMATCLVLALLAKPNTAPKSIFDTPAPEPAGLPAIPVPAPPAQTPPASEAPALPVPGESPNGGASLSPTVTPAPAVAPPAPSTPPAAIAPAAQPAPSAEKPKAKKAPQTGTAHTPGQ